MQTSYIGIFYFDARCGFVGKTDQSLKQKNFFVEQNDFDDIY